MLFFLAIAFAGVPIVLPAGEEQEAWSPALELADLTWADAAPLSVAVVPGGWVIRASSADGTVRTLRVDRPTDAAAREEFAFLARGMARELAMVRDARDFGPTAAPVDPVPMPSPDAALTSRPLPVLPPRPKPVPVPVAPTPVAPSVVVPPVEPVEPIAPVEPVEPVVPAAPEPEPPEDLSPPPPIVPDVPFEDLDPVQPDEPARYWSLRVAYPPLYVFGGARARTDRDLGGLFGVGIRGVERGSFALDLTVSYNIGQPLQLPNSSGLFRTEQGLQAELCPTAKVTPGVGLSAMVGVEHRVYNQEGGVIDATTVPIAGAALQVEAFSGRRVTPYIRAGVDVDLTTIKFQDEFRRVSTVSRVEGGLLVGVRFSTRRDPNARMPTLSP